MQRDYSITDRLLVEYNLKNLLKSWGYQFIDRHYDLEAKQKHILFDIEDSQGRHSVHLIDDNEIWKYRNFFIEDGSDRETHWEVGWMHKCEADIIFYIDRYNQWLYLLDWKKTLHYVRTDKEQKLIEFYNKTDNCNTYCYLLKVHKASQKGLIKKIYSLKDGKLLS